MFNELNMLKIFFEEPNREFNVREVARILKIAPATASNKLNLFKEEGILNERKERFLKLYKSNLENELYKDLKIFYNIRKIKESKLIDNLNKFYLKPTIVLFGSATSGLDTETSDFDLLIISEKTKEFPELIKFEKVINRKLHILVFKDIKDLKDTNIINNILNGITLQGKIKWT